MASINATVTNSVVSPMSASIAPGEPVSISFKITNTGAFPIHELHVILCSGTAAAPTGAYLYTFVYDLYGLSIARNTSRTISLTVPFPALGSGAPHVIEHVCYNVFILTNSGDPIAGDTTGANIHKDLPFAALDRRYAPAIPTFAVRRNPTEESAGAAVSIRCTLAAGANPLYSGLSLKLQWRERGQATFPGANQLAINIAQALSANGATVYPSYVFEPGKEYALRVTFTDGIDTAFAETILAKSFAVFDVSPDGHGFAVGQYATGTEQAPKFECQYPAHFYGGIKNLAQALGIQTGEAAFGTPQHGAAANAYTDAAVTFPTPYKEAPLLFLSARLSTTGVNMGSHLYALLTDSLTANGFTVRWYNNTSTDRWPTVRWTAMGDPDVD